MSEHVDFLGQHYEEIKESEKDFLKELESLFLNKQDSVAKAKIEKYLTNSGVDVSKLSFHEAANHIEWKKDGKDYFILERNWR